LSLRAFGPRKLMKVTSNPQAVQHDRDFRPWCIPAGVFAPGLKALCIRALNTALKGRSYTGVRYIATVEPL